jgi:hypothetical protein
LIEVAYYRVDAEKWRQEIDAYVEPGLEAYERGATTGATAAGREHHATFLKQTFTRGLPRDYNDAVGWVQLECDGSGVVKGYAFRTRQKGVRRGFDHQFEYLHKVLEARFNPRESSEVIAAELRRRLAALTRRGGSFAGRDADLRAFDSLAPFVNWRALLGLDRP